MDDEVNFLLYKVEQQKRKLQEIEWMEREQRREKEKYYMKLYHSQDTKAKDQAKKYFIQQHTNYVKKHIKDWNKYARDDYYDLYNSAIVGILEALKKFDPEKSLFITWSNRYIHHQLYNYMCEMKFQCSEHYARLQHTVKKAIQFLKEKGIECTVYNICKYTGLSSKIVKRELRIMELKIVSLEELEEYI